MGQQSLVVEAARGLVASLVGVTGTKMILVAEYGFSWAAAAVVGKAMEC